MNKKKEMILLSDVHKYFAIDGFREAQGEIIEQILKGKDCLALMATGSGKSLCYQYPALKKEGLTIVISPLIALMDDQVKSLQQKGLPAARLHGELREEERADTMKRVLKGEIKILYVSPEKLLSPKFINYSKKLKISLLVVDEAHSISIFGYGFRPSYLNLSRYFKQIGKKLPVAAFTATAPEYVQTDIVELLEMKKPVIIDSVKDYKMQEVRIQEVNHPQEKWEELLRFMAERRKESGIIYCSTVENVKAVKDFLKSHKIRAREYYSDLKQERKESCHKAFTEGKCKVVVATNAFGMGIDKQDVRYVIHFDVPRDMESYVQEMGRAGRDGNPADCLLLYHKEDGKRLKQLVSMKDKDYFKEDMVVEYERKLKLERLNHILSFIENSTGKPSKELQNEIKQYLAKNPLSNRLKEEAAQIRKSLIKNMKHPDRLSMNLTKIANTIKNQEYQVGVFEDLGIGEKGSDKSVSFKLDRRLSYFDLCVADAVYSLYYAGKEKIYLQNLIEVLSGDRDALLKRSKTESANSLEKHLQESLERMSETTLVIDRRRAKIGFGTEVIMEGRFLNLKREGKTAYVILETPLLYHYAEQTNGQIAGASFAYLKVRALPNSLENILLKHYIVYSIKIRKPINYQSKKINRNINLYKAIRKIGIELPVDTSARNRKIKTIQKKVEKILEHEKELGLIADFRFHENGETVKLEFFGETK